jgi:hypothetical protein
VAFSLEWNVPLGAAVLGAAVLGAAVLELPLDEGAAGVVVVVAALAELPVNSAAPIAPPVRVEPTIATAMAVLRMGFMFGGLLLFGTRSLRVDPQPAAGISRDPGSSLGKCSDLQAAPADGP